MITVKLQDLDVDAENYVDFLFLGREDIIEINVDIVVYPRCAVVVKNAIKKKFPGIRGKVMVDRT